MQLQGLKKELIYIDVSPSEILNNLEGKEISAYELIKVCCFKWKKEVTGYRDAHVIGDYWHVEVERHTSHSWYEAKRIREATTLEIETYKCFSLILENLR